MMFCRCKMTNYSKEQVDQILAENKKLKIEVKKYKKREKIEKREFSEFIKNDLNQNIFNDSVFDFVILYGVLQNVDDQKGIIKDYIAKLKTGGKLSIDVTKAGKFYTHLLNPKYFWRNFFKRIKKRSR